MTWSTLVLRLGMGTFQKRQCLARESVKKSLYSHLCSYGATTSEARAAECYGSKSIQFRWQRSPDGLSAADTGLVSLRTVSWSLRKSANKSPCFGRRSLWHLWSYGKEVWLPSHGKGYLGTQYSTRQTVGYSYTVSAVFQLVLVPFQFLGRLQDDRSRSLKLESLVTTVCSVWG